MMMEGQGDRFICWDHWLLLTDLCPSYLYRQLATLNVICIKTNTSGSRHQAEKAQFRQQAFPSLANSSQQNQSPTGTAG
ncbi:hypothetical protein DNK01_19095 [Stutzerimonas kirkiae]|nr:hypothetical protein DNK01_19095 [Stutzerimonas kirkiae]